VHKLVDQARFPDPGLAHHGRHLALPRSGLQQGLLQQHEFLVPSDKLT
jgi:hypothetical protein